MGPDLMENMRAQAERFGAELVTDDVQSGATWPGDVKTVADWPTGVEHRARAVILATGSAYRELGRARREAALRARGVVVRHLRRVLLPGPGHRRRRRRRLGGRGGDLPDQVRPDGHHRAPPGRAARLARSWPSARHANPKIRVRVEQRGRGHPRRGQGHRRDAARHRDRRDRASCRSPGCSSRSATTRAPNWSRAQVDLDAEGYVARGGPHAPAPTSPGSSRAATSSTTPTGRPSPPPAPAAPPPWTPSGTSPTAPAHGAAGAPSGRIDPRPPPSPRS